MCDYYGVNTVEEKTTSENKKTLYTVQVGAFSNKANAIKSNATLEELKLLVKNLETHWIH